MEMQQGLTMRTFKIRVATVPPKYEVEALGAKTTYRIITARGYTLKDAKRRAGIQ